MAFELSLCNADPTHDITSSKEQKDEDIDFTLDADDDVECVLDTCVITKSMIEEEDRLHNDDPTSKKEEKFQPISVEERLNRLTFLLEKSKVYADSLMKVIEERKKAEMKRAAKKEKMLKKQKQNCSEISATAPDTLKHRNLKRNRGSDDDVKRTKRVKLAQEDTKNSINELLQSKLYMPKLSDVVSQVDENDGVRYFGDQVINPSQPSLFTGGLLRQYQIVGYQWLKVLFTNAVNGILADEMGLGKTIQCIAIICHIIKMGFQGPFLVCAPLSTVGNWINEFKTFAPKIPLLLYHGTAAERAVLSQHISDMGECVKSHPVVITSYEVLMRDRPVLSKFHWDYLILDEGHRIKNMKCKLLKELKQLNIGAKLLLTGTPLQNNLAELWSLLNFIIPEVFDDLQVFESWFNFGESKMKNVTDFSYEQEEKFLSTLYEILTPFLLRRVKADVDLDLPPKSEVILYAPFSPKQEKFYQAAINKTIRNLFGDEEDQNLLTPKHLSDISNNVTRSKTKEIRLNEKQGSKISLQYGDSDINVSLNNIVMLLRKCSNHPYLIEYPLIPGTDYFKVDEELVSSSGKLMMLDRILTKLKERGHKVLIFSQMTKMLDILDDYIQLRKYSCVRIDGSTKMENRQKNIKLFNHDPNVFAFLLSTRAGGLGINLTAADTVIIFDSDWNPQNDLQAQDRCHRIGQTKPVMIYRLVTASSIDQEMVERAAEKRKLEKMVMHENKFKGNLDVELKQKLKIGRSEILRMIKSRDLHAVVDSKDFMTDEALEKLLDRRNLL